MWNQLVDWLKGALPDVDDEGALHAWLNTILGLLRWIVARTETDLDNQAVDALASLVEDSEKWQVVYPLIVTLFGDGVVGLEQEAPKLAERHDVAGVASRVGLPIGPLIQAVLLILRLLRG